MRASQRAVHPAFDVSSLTPARVYPHPSAPDPPPTPTPPLPDIKTCTQLQEAVNAIRTQMVSDAARSRWFLGHSYFIYLTCPEAGGSFGDCARLNTTKTNAVLWLQGAGRVYIQPAGGGACGTPPTLKAASLALSVADVGGEAYNPEGEPAYASAFLEESNARYAASALPGGGDAAPASAPPGAAPAAFDFEGLAWDASNDTNSTNSTNTTTVPNLARFLVAEGWRVGITLRGIAFDGEGRRPCVKLESTRTSYFYNVAFLNCVAATCPYKRPFARKTANGTTPKNATATACGGGLLLVSARLLLDSVRFEGCGAYYLRRANDDPIVTDGDGGWGQQGWVGVAQPGVGTWRGAANSQHVQEIIKCSLIFGTSSCLMRASTQSPNKKTTPTVSPLFPHLPAGFGGAVYIHAGRMQAPFVWRGRWWFGNILYMRSCRFKGGGAGLRPSQGPHMASMVESEVAACLPVHGPPAETPNRCMQCQASRAGTACCGAPAATASVC
jgi:hypothetical protein